MSTEAKQGELFAGDNSNEAPPAETVLMATPAMIRELDALRTIARLAVDARRAQGFYFRARGRGALDAGALLTKARNAEHALDTALMSWLEKYRGEPKL